MNPPQDARYEVKFAAREADLDRVLRWLRLHRAGFTEAFAERQVHNVYFDTHDHEALAEKLAGVSSRSKLRYRWYGDAALPQAGTLELKCRRNTFGWKPSCKVPAAPSTTTWTTFARELRRLLPPAARRWLDDHPAVVLTNRYRRRYFASADGRLRATIDTDLTVWDQRFAAAPNLDRPAPVPGQIVLELKFGRDARDFAAQCLHDVPIRVSAHSKYALAVAAISAR